MPQPTPDPALAAQVADELEDCRQRGLIRLDQPLGRSRKRIAAPEVSRLASAYCAVLGLRLGSRIQEIRQVLTDSLAAYGEHDEWAAKLLRILYFGKEHSRGHLAGEYLDEALLVFLGRDDQVRPSDIEERRFHDYRHHALFPLFAAFLIAFVSQAEATAPVAASGGTVEPATAVTAPRRRAQLLVPGGAGVAVLLILLLGGYLIFRTWPFVAVPPSPPTARRSPAHAETLYWEQEGHLGEPDTYADPSDPAVTGPGVPVLAKVQVSCKVYAPSFQSVSPDGYWYRLASKPWNNHYYGIANTFLNGDPVNGTSQAPQKNTDWRVPNCA